MKLKVPLAKIALAFALLAARPAFSQPPSGLPSAADSIRKTQPLSRLPASELENGAFAASNPFALLSQRPPQIRVQPYTESFSEFYGAKIRGMNFSANYQLPDAIGVAPGASFSYTYRNYPDFPISVHVLAVVISAKVQSPLSTPTFPQHAIAAFAFEKTVSSAGGFDYPIQSALSFAYSADVAAISFTRWLSASEGGRAGGLQTWAAVASAFPINGGRGAISRLALTWSYTATGKPGEHTGRNFHSIGIDVQIREFRIAASSALKHSAASEASLLFSLERIIFGAGVSHSNAGSGLRATFGCFID